MARRQLKLTVEREPYEVATAQLILNDESRTGTFNHPRILVTLRPLKDDCVGRRVQASINFQRNFYSSLEQHWRPATGLLDTRLRWSVCYASGIELDRHRADVLGGNPFKQYHPDKVRIALARRIGRAIRDGNLHRVEPDCECLRVLAALDRLGVYVRPTYFHGGRTDLDREGLDLCEVHDRGANRRAEKEEREEATVVAEKQCTKCLTTLTAPALVTDESGVCGDCAGVA